MFVWDKSSRTVLNVLIGSTATKYYTSEIVKLSSLSWPTVHKTLTMLAEANIVLREEERFQYDSPAREARVYYTLNPELIDYFRLPEL